MPSAHRTVGQSASRWEIHPWHGCKATDESLAFSHRSVALFWLRQFRTDAIVMANFRSVISEYSRVGSPLWRKTDEQVLDDLSWLLSEGVLHVHRVPPPLTAWQTGTETAPTEIAPAARPTPSQSSAAPVARVVEDADTFSSQLDAAAMAAVLSDAAASGVPFCEECAKAAAAARQAA